MQYVKYWVVKNLNLEMYYQIGDKFSTSLNPKTVFLFPTEEQADMFAQRNMLSFYKVESVVIGR